MDIPRDFFYANKVDEFVRLMKKQRIDDIIDIMCDRAQESGVSCGTSEIKSWKCNFEAIHKLLLKSEVAGDAVIAFEYKVPVGGRIDCVMFGHGMDNAANMLHIELKQWSNNNVSEYYSGYTFSTDIVLDGARQIRYESHPSAQAHEYQCHLENYVHAFEDENIKLYGFAFCYNYLSNHENAVLCSDTYDHVTRRCPLYCQDQMGKFAQELKELLGKGKGEDIMNKVVKSKMGTTKRLQDAARNMFDGKCAKEEFALIGDQLDAYNSILGAIKNTDKTNRKTVIIVKGGPGTGKSVIAFRLVSGLAKTLNFKNVLYSTRSTSLLNGYKTILRNVSYADNVNCNAVDLIVKNARIKPKKYGENGIDALVVDEAHRIENSSNDMNDKSRDQLTTHLTQIMTMLFTARVSIFFIDDKQSVKGKEIGSSERIKEAAENYYERIKQENKKYKESGRHIYGDSFEYTCPQITDVEIMEFELKDQFRCNGSNNYLDWITNILYGGGEKVTLDKSKYEFDILDTPEELNAKIRSLDDYAKFADSWKIEQGPKFSYKALHKEVKSKVFENSARLVANWCWHWTSKEDQKKGLPVLQKNGDLIYDVTFDYDKNGVRHTFSMPWETQKKGPKAKNDFTYKYAKDADHWLISNEGINQIGCIHSAQGWETDYVGVIISSEVKYDKEKDCLVFDEKCKNYDPGVRQVQPEFTTITRNIYRVLMTRGKKGCFVYACDPQVRDYFKRMMNQ